MESEAVSPGRPGDLCLPPDNEGSLAARSQTAPYSEMLWRRDWNTDESLAGKHPLPPVVSATAEDWKRTERPRILRQFKDLMYGEMPPGPDRLRTETLSERGDALDGLAVRKEIRIHCGMRDGRGWHFDMLLYVPKDVPAPPPVFVGLNFDGNQHYAAEPDVRMTRSVWCDTARGWALRPFETRCRDDESWNFRGAAARGYAVATAAYGEIAPDHLNGLQSSVFTLFYGDRELRMDYQVPFAEHKAGFRRPVSMIGAWSWGLSRMLDALEEERLVDAGRAAVVGHSRLGKASLWAGACDPRFRLVISNDSGCAGASLSRRRFGESLRILYWEQRPWLSPNVVDYIDRPETMPIDQHLLLALAAPRRLYVASASEDLNADPRGEFLAARAASAAWRLYGKTGLQAAEMPEPDVAVGDQVGYHLRSGRHGIRYFDWERYYDFADRCFRCHS